MLEKKIRAVSKIAVCGGLWQLQGFDANWVKREVFIIHSNLWGQVAEASDRGERLQHLLSEAAVRKDCVALVPLHRGCFLVCPVDGGCFCISAEMQCKVKSNNTVGLSTACYKLYFIQHQLRKMSCFSLACAESMLSFYGEIKNVTLKSINKFLLQVLLWMQQLTVFHTRK